MGKIIDRTGEVYRELEIIEELGNKQVKCKCLKCNHIDVYVKPEVTRCKVICRRCGTRVRIGKIGEIYDKLQILENVGEEKLICQCIKCGHKDRYVKGKVLNKTARCKSCYPTFIDRTGKTFNSLQIITELGNNKVLAKCILCNSIKEYDKSRIVKGKTKTCGCINIQLENLTGRVFGSLKIIKELGRGKVIASCLLCGSEKEYRKANIKAGATTTCGCKTKCLKDKTGEQFGKLTIITESNKVMVLVQCIICGHLDEYTKAAVVNNHTVCKKCGLKLNYKGAVLNNVTILELAYIGRNGHKYYQCKCNICGEELILTREEIVKYSCTKEHNNG